MTFPLLVSVLGALSLVGCASPENTAAISNRIGFAVAVIQHRKTRRVKLAGL
jgi:hypothetical protein